MDGAGGLEEDVHGSSLDKRRLALVVAALLLVLATAGIISVATLGGSNLVGTAAAQANSLLQLINRRSPGERAEGELAKLKNKWALPHERALPKIAINLPVPTFERPTTLQEIVEPPSSLPVTFDKASLPTINELSAGPESPSIIPPDSGPVIVPPGAGPPGSGPPAIVPPGSVPPVIVPPSEGPPVVPPIVVPNNPPPSPPPVPEPSTWMTMLLGFALLGMQVRKATKLEQAS